MLLIRRGKRFLNAGEVFVTKRPTTVSTVLGSCVSVCLADPTLGFGGINHYMESQEIKAQTLAAPESYRYGEPAIRGLINRMLRLGCRKKDMVCAVFGGGNVIDLMFDVGKSNISVAREVLTKEGIRVSKWDVGGRHGRRIVFRTDTGLVRVSRVGSIRDYFNEDGTPIDHLHNSSMDIG